MKKTQLQHRISTNSLVPISTSSVTMGSWSTVASHNEVLGSNPLIASYHASFCSVDVLCLFFFFLISCMFACPMHAHVHTHLHQHNHHLPHTHTHAHIHTHTHTHTQTQSSIMHIFPSQSTNTTMHCHQCVFVHISKWPS